MVNRKQAKNLFMASYIALKLSVSYMKDVNASIITIGDELLIGQTIDTNSAFIGQELNKIGIWVKKRIAVGDVREEILGVLKAEADENDIIIITGGLGPTADDITKPTLCEFFNTSLAIDGEALRNVTDIFTKIGRPLIERNLRQAEVPSNCIVLQNKRGTAPGMWWGPERDKERDSLNNNSTIFISLPGVPHEMKGLMTDSVIPRLKEVLELPAVWHRTLLTSGMGESMLAETIQEYETHLPRHI